MKFSPHFVYAFLPMVYAVVATFIHRYMLQKYFRKEDNPEGKYTPNIYKYVFVGGKAWKEYLANFLIYSAGLAGLWAVLYVAFFAAMMGHIK